MIPVVTAAEAGRMDERADSSVDVLMDRAGLAVALATVGEGAGYGTRVVVLCGPGNNGGDGYVAARYLHRRGVAVRVEALSPPRSAPAVAAAESARRAGVAVSAIGDPRKADLVVDAVFGGGFRRGVPEEIRPWMHADIPVVAVDVPTGLNPDTGIVEDEGFSAVHTVTFGALKVGHLLAEGPDRCGQVTVADIGLGPGQPQMQLVEAPDAVRPERPRRVHKWSGGSVLVVGGSEGMVGAAVMAGRAALHFGASAVGVVSREHQGVTLLAPELLTYRMDRLDEALDRYDVVIVGPGLGEESQTIVETVLRRATRVVADADALRGRDTLAAAPAELIITPHAGEFGRLSSDEPGPDGARNLAQALGAVVVLKGAPTFVTGGGIPWVINAGGPELATIGTGDVLAGMTASLWARGLDAEGAARSAAYWHGVAGADLATTATLTADRLAVQVGRWSGLD